MLFLLWITLFALYFSSIEEVFISRQPSKLRGWKETKPRLGLHAKQGSRFCNTDKSVFRASTQAMS